MVLSLVTGPQVDPVTIAEVKRHCRIDGANDDAVLQLLIRAATARAEAATGRQFVRATWDAGDDGFEEVLVLPRPPLIDVTSITYIDTAGAAQVLASSAYQVSAPAGPFAGYGYIRPAYGQSWPAARTDTINAVTVRFRAGYGTTGEAVPADLRMAVLLMISAWYDESRGDLIAAGLQVSPLGARALLTPYKLHG